MEPRRRCSEGLYTLIACMALHITALFSPIGGCVVEISPATIETVQLDLRSNGTISGFDPQSTISSILDVFLDEATFSVKEYPLNTMSGELCVENSPASPPSSESQPPQSNNALFCMNTPPIPEPPYGPMPSPNSPLRSPPLIKPNSPPRFSPFPSPQKPMYPPPAAVHLPPPPQKQPRTGVWCVAKPSVPDPIVQEAMDYACGSGADCKSIQPSGPCFKPNTVFAHASYAFNSYWQNRKSGGGTCDFGGTAMLVTVDPSSDECPFTYDN